MFDDRLDSTEFHARGAAPTEGAPERDHETRSDPGGRAHTEDARTARVDRERARRRGLRAALRVAGLSGLLAAAVGHAAEEPSPNLPGSVRTAGGGCCGSWRFWGPPAPVAMRRGALGRLRRARARARRAGRGSA